MIYRRIGDNSYSNSWSYNAQGKRGLVEVTNNENDTRLLNSITLKLGKGADGRNSGATGNNAILNCTGQTFEGWLEYGDIDSTRCNITNNCPIVNKSYWDYDYTKNYTFKFNNPISIGKGDTITLYWNSNPLTACQAFHCSPFAKNVIISSILAFSHNTEGNAARTSGALSTRISTSNFVSLRPTAPATSMISGNCSLLHLSTAYCWSISSLDMENTILPS